MSVSLLLVLFKKLMSLNHGINLIFRTACQHIYFLKVHKGGERKLNLIVLLINTYSFVQINNRLPNNTMKSAFNKPAKMAAISIPIFFFY